MNPQKSYIVRTNFYDKNGDLYRSEFDEMSVTFPTGSSPDWDADAREILEQQVFFSDDPEGGWREFELMETIFIKGMSTHIR